MQLPKADVYRNLSQFRDDKRKHWWSIRVAGLVGGRGGSHVLMRNAELIVSQKGNARCRRLGKRTVHAYARGEVVASCCCGVTHEEGCEVMLSIGDKAWRQTFYNPFQHTEFQSEDGDLHAAEWVWFSPMGAFFV